ncbi:hypothetical protein CYMTET_46613 [Cymbomonas tetramitiformis]|uniref:Uncharacterized protein n=1 Tax=Cymbomonas tetramitiformis TaxID=36881 RepID=A0AAE0BVT5_9CHLO|nr:hypothetical protein CYMTET_46613 [Cymbomonas tetramitiformis]
MTKLNEGLAKRQEMRRLKKARQDLCATIGNLPATGNADRIRRMQQEMGDLDQRIHAMYVDMVAQDQCIYVEGHGFFFAEFWLAPDLKALKGMLGIPQSGRAPHPCPHCDVKRDEIHDITKTWGERTDHQKVLPIPMSHVRPCGMHLIHRVNEKLTQLLTKLVWSSENKDEWDEHMEANHLRLLNFFNDELKLNGGHCKIEIKEKEGKVYPGKIPMNGPECKRFIDRWAEAVGMIWYLPEETIQKLLSIGKKWARCMEYITKPFYNDYAPEEEEYEEEGALDERELRDQRIRMEGNDRVNAHEAFRAFVEAYADYAGSGVTHYMHIMYYHPEWITGSPGECPAIYTNQATERSNSVDRRAVIRKTMKGKALTGPLARAVCPSGVVTWGPAIVELLGWGTRMMGYRLHDLQRGAQREWWDIDIRELNLLVYAYDIRRDTIWTEDLLLKKLGLPQGKRIRIIGKGNLKEDEDNEGCFNGMHIQVSEASKAAIHKFEEKGGRLEPRKTCGKKRHCQRDPEVVEALTQRKNQKMADITKTGLAKDGLAVFATITPLSFRPWA